MQYACTNRALLSCILHFGQKASSKVTYILVQALEIIFVEINGHVAASFVHMDPKHLFMALTFGLKVKHWSLELGNYNSR